MSESINKLIFCKVQDVCIRGDFDALLGKFIQKYLVEDKRCKIRIRDISNAYVLVCEDCDKEEFINMMTLEQREDFDKYRCSIFGVMDISNSKIDENMKYIEWIDTFIPNLSLAYNMVTQYEDYTGNTLIPRKFITESVDYWAYFFYEEIFEELSKKSNLCEMDIYHKVGEYYNIDLTKFLREIDWKILVRKFC